MTEFSIIGKLGYFICNPSFMTAFGAPAPVERSITMLASQDDEWNNPSNRLVEQRRSSMSILSDPRSDDVYRNYARNTWNEAEWAVKSTHVLRTAGDPVPDNAELLEVNRGLLFALAAAMPDWTPENGGKFVAEPQMQNMNVNLRMGKVGGQSRYSIVSGGEAFNAFCDSVSAGVKGVNALISPRLRSTHVDSEFPTDLSNIREFNDTHPLVSGEENNWGLGTLTAPGSFLFASPEILEVDGMTALTQRRLQRIYQAVAGQMAYLNEHGGRVTTMNVPVPPNNERMAWGATHFLSGVLGEAQDIVDFARRALDVVRRGEAFQDASDVNLVIPDRKGRAVSFSVDNDTAMQDFVEAAA